MILKGSQPKTGFRKSRLYTKECTLYSAINDADCILLDCHNGLSIEIESSLLLSGSDEI